jgi:uncharacterized membrane protein YccC
VSEAIHRLSSLGQRWPSLTVSPTTAYVIRFAVAVTASIWIGKAPGLVENSSKWILITVLTVLQPTAGGSVMKGLLRAVGTVVGAFAAILLFGLFAQDPPLLLVGFALLQMIGAYGHTGPRFQYAWFVSAFTMAIVLGSAMAGKEAVETLAFQRASMVGIGILLVFLVDSLLWPARAEPRLRESLASRARALGDVLRPLVDGSAVPASDEPVTPQSGPGALADQLGLVNAARMEIGVSRSRADALLRLTLLLEALSSRARVLSQPIEAGEASNTQEPALLAARAELGRRLGAALETVATALGAGHAVPPYAEGLSRALLDLEVERERVALRNGPSRALEGRASELGDLVAILSAIEKTLSLASGGESAEEKRGEARPFFSWRPDPLRTRVAIRAGTAVVAAFLVPMALGWPVNTLVGPIAFLVACLTRGAAVQTLTSMAVVIGIGWALADFVIVYLTPIVDRAPLAWVLAFVLAAALAYGGASRPRLVTLPLWGALVALLSIFGGSGAPTNVYGTYNLVCYFALAMGVGWLFSQMMWPASAAGLFRQRIAAQLEPCRETVRRAAIEGEEGRRQRVADLFRSCVQQSTHLTPLHAHARHEPVERALDEERRAEILGLAMDLMDAVLGDRPGSIEALSERGGDALRPLIEARRDEHEALLDSLQRVISALHGQPGRAGLDLDRSRRAVEDRLAELRARPGVLARLDAAERHRVLVELDSRERLVGCVLAIDHWHAEWERAESARG